MKECKRCGVKVIDDTNSCPLCKSVLSGKVNGQNNYPEISLTIKNYNLLIKICLFLSIVGSIICIVVNYITYNKYLWSVISIAAILYSWSIILHAIKRNINIASKILVQTICIAILIFIIDNVLGYQGWSVNYVIPGLIVTANIAILVMIISNRMKWKSYVLYQIVICILGLIPIFLYLIGAMNKEWTVWGSAILSFAILTGTLIFSDNDVKDELRRRFHV